MRFDDLRREQEESARIQREQVAHAQAQFEARRKRTMAYWQASGLEQLLAELCHDLRINEEPSQNFVDETSFEHVEHFAFSPFADLHYALDGTIAHLVYCIPRIEGTSYKIPYGNAIMVACYENGIIDVVGAYVNRIIYQDWHNNIQRLEEELKNACRYPYAWGR